MNGKSILIGFLVSLVLAALFGTYTGLTDDYTSVPDGIFSSMMFIVGSIICTAGIGLVGWIPIWWGLGALALALWEGTRPSETKSENPLRLDHGQQLVVDFIQKQRARGALSRNEINNRLREMGWSDATIEQSNQTVDSA